MKRAEREVTVLPPSRSDRWQAIFLKKRLRSPIPITVCRGTCNERGARSSPRKRQAGAGSSAGFYDTKYFHKEYISGTLILRVYTKGGIFAILAL